MRHDFLDKAVISRCVRQINAYGPPNDQTAISSTVGGRVQLVALFLLELRAIEAAKSHTLNAYVYQSI